MSSFIHLLSFKSLDVGTPLPVPYLRFLADIYLLNTDAELARLLQTCLVNLLQTTFAARYREEDAEIVRNFLISKE